MTPIVIANANPHNDGFYYANPPNHARDPNFNGGRLHEETSKLLILIGLEARAGAETNDFEVLRSQTGQKVLKQGKEKAKTKAKENSESQANLESAIDRDSSVAINGVNDQK